MTGHLAQTREQLAQEIEFWRDFIPWWERKHGRQAGARMLAALATAESRYRSADHLQDTEQHGIPLAKIPRFNLI